MVVRDPWPGAPLFECIAVQGAPLDIGRKPHFFAAVCGGCKTFVSTCSLSLD